MQAKLIRPRTAANTKHPLYGTQLSGVDTDQTPQVLYILLKECSIVIINMKDTAKQPPKAMDSSNDYYGKATSSFYM